MGFTDLMSSSRGPGVIGTLVALLVLVGFGTLYLFVFDESLQGGQKKIEAVIRDQGLMIESNKVEIESRRKRVENADRLKIVGKEADGLKVRAELAAKRIAELTASKEAATAGVAAATADWENYKDDYRKSEWAAAVGEDLGELTSVSGRVYSQVKIRKVDHTGIQITDSTGPKSIDSAELPPELRDRFQFDSEKKAAVVADRNQVVDIHSDNVAIVALATKANGKLERVKELESQVQALTTEIETATQNIPRFSAEISNLQGAIAAERTKRISNAPQLEVRLAELKKSAEKSRASIATNQAKVREANSEITTLNREVVALKVEIEKVKKELKEKAPAAPQP